MRKLREQEPDGFSTFWDIWRPHMRHTDGRGDARRAFRKHVLDGAEPQDIIDGARAFLRNLAEKDRPYIPLAASWINKESYADWCERERQFQARQEQQQTNVVQMSAPRGNTLFLQRWEEKKQESV